MHHNRLIRGGIASVLTMLLACSADSQNGGGDDEARVDAPTATVSSALSVAVATPNSGVAGTSVTITGSGFGATQGSSNVYFRGTEAATISSWCDTQIVLKVPSTMAAGAQQITVRVNGVDSPGIAFTVAPSITSFSPLIVTPGTSVTINGANFGATSASGVLTFAGYRITPTSWSMNSIVAKLGGGATGDVPVTLTVNSVAAAPSQFSTTSSSMPALSNPTGREAVYPSMDQGTQAAADSILQDSWPTDGFAAAQLPSSLTWSEDPYNDASWRKQFYGFGPMRHLLATYRSTGNTAYLNKLLSTIRCFSNSGQSAALAQDPYSTALRGAFLVDAYWKLRRAGVISASDELMLRTLIHSTGTFLYASANYEDGSINAIAESAALLSIATNFSTFSEAATWSSTAQSRLQTYASNAIDGSGIARDHSAYSQYELLSQLWYVTKWAQAYAPVTGNILKRTVTAMALPAAHLMQPDGRIPMIGASPARTVRGDSVFDEVAAGNAALLLPAQPQLNWSLSSGTAGTAPSKRLDLFRTGLTTMRSNWASSNFNNATQVVFDWRMASNASNDRDLLNVVAYSAGRPILVDSGMYSNEGSSAWGSYFRSTAAHNTVLVDGESQPAGAVAAPGAVCDLTYATGHGLDPYCRGAHHSAYSGVVHSRSVALIDKDIIVIFDHLKSETSHTYEQIWHLTPDATQVSTSGTSVTGKDGSGNALVTVRTQASTVDSWDFAPQVSTARGAVSPADGWMSESAGTTEANYAVHYTAQGTEVVFATMITSGAHLTDSNAQVHAYNWSAPGAWMRGGEAYVGFKSSGANAWYYLEVEDPGEGDEWSQIVDDSW